MLFNKKLFIICSSILGLLLFTLLTFSILGRVERKGYLSEFSFTEIIDNQYVYKTRVKYHSTVFRSSDIYGVYPKSTNLPKYIKNIDWDENGSPFGRLYSDTEIKKDAKIDIFYTLKIKNIFYLELVFIVILGYSFTLILIFLRKRPNDIKAKEDIENIKNIFLKYFNTTFIRFYAYNILLYFPIILLFLFANLILTGLVLSLFKSLNNIFLYTALILIFTFVFLFVLKKKKLIPTLNSFQPDSSINKYFLPSILLSLPLLLIIFLSFITCLIFIPNNFDSQTYHLPRIFLYFSQGNLDHFYTPNSRQIAFPFNHTLVQMFVVQYNLPHRFFSLINFSSYIASGLIVYQISRYLKVNQFFSFVSMFLGMTGIMVVAQSSTTQSDILLAFPTLLSVLYAMKYFDSFNMKYALLTTLSFGIASGIKPTLIYAIPVIGIAGIIIIIKGILNKKVLIKKLFPQLIIGGFLIFLFATPYIAINYYNLGALSDPTQDGYINSPYSFLTSIHHSIILTMQAIFTPIIELFRVDTFNKIANDFYLNPLTNNHHVGAIKPLNIFVKTLNEDIVWFGLGTFFIIGALIYSIIAFFKDKKNTSKQYAFLISLLVLSFFYGYAILMKWQPWASRFMITPFLLASSISGYFLHSIFINASKKPYKKILLFLFFLLLLYKPIEYQMKNSRRGLYSFIKNPIFALNYIQTPVPNNISDLRNVEKIAIVGTEVDDRIYPFFRYGNRNTQYINSQNIKEGYYNIIGSFKNINKINNIDSPTTLLLSIENKKVQKFAYMGLGIKEWFSYDLRDSSEKINYTNDVANQVLIKINSFNSIEAFGIEKYDDLIYYIYMKSNNTKELIASVYYDNIIYFDSNTNIINNDSFLGYVILIKDINNNILSEEIFSK